MRSTRLPGWLVTWIASYVFFLFSLVNNFSASHDSINYLDNIVNGENLFHQHHLLYHFLARQWLMLFAPTGVAPHYIIESFTALWGSSVLSLCYLFFRNRFQLTLISSILSMAIIAFSYGIWFYSVNIEVYTPPLFFILLCLYLLSSPGFSEKYIWKLALTTSLAILFHQLNVLFVVVVAGSFFFNLGRGRFWMPTIKYCLLAGLITLTAYFIVGWTIEKHDSINALTNWMLGYTVGHGYWHSPSLRTPIDVVTGFSHAFIGGHYLFQLPGVESYLQNSFHAHGLRDEIFLSRKISGAMAWALLVLSLIFAFLLVSLLIRFIKRFRSLPTSMNILRPLLLCLMVYSIFFCFWMPEILEFWIPQMVIVWLILLGTLPATGFPLKIKQRTGLVILAAAIFFVNFFGSMKMLQDIGNDWYYTETKRLQSTIRQNDLVIIKDSWILKYYINHYTEARAVGVDEKRPQGSWHRVLTYENGRLSQSD